MKIERLKSILLIILVISSIVLTANKWFDEELWPEGYSFFSGVKKYFVGNNDTTNEIFNANEEILKPAKIIVNNLSNHVLLTKSSENYDSIYEEIKAMLSLSLVSDGRVMADAAEWNDHLKSKSFYFSYPVMYDASYFASQLSASYSGKIKYFKEFVVANDQRLPSVTYIYIKDAETEEIEKIKINYQSDTVETLIKNAANDTNDINYYSFELNFDNNDKGIEDHVVIDHDVLINIAEKKTSRISERNLFYNIASNETMYSNILAKFKYNTSNIRKYIESDDSMVFVENYGTLKLHSNGQLSYKSVDEIKGIALDTSNTNACLNSCITFVNDITALMGVNRELYYEISSDIHDITGQNFTLTFDYYINDNIILIPEEKYSVKNAITVKVANGKIVSYDQIFVSYMTTDEEISCGSAIEAIDRLGNQGEPYSETVSDIFLAYKFDDEYNFWVPMWFIEDSKGKIYMISSNAEVVQ